MPEKNNKTKKEKKQNNPGLITALLLFVDTFIFNFCKIKGL
jgi:hypothetical protein